MALILKIFNCSINFEKENFKKKGEIKKVTSGNFKKLKGDVLKKCQK
jgi:hypothetical protein